MRWARAWPQAPARARACFVGRYRRHANSNPDLRPSKAVGTNTCFVVGPGATQLKLQMLPARSQRPKTRRDAQNNIAPPIT
eukprot:14278759-Alexandrium_andersonii.AAC.1